VTKPGFSLLCLFLCYLYSLVKIYSGVVLLWPPYEIGQVIIFLFGLV